MPRFNPEWTLRLVKDNINNTAINKASEGLSSNLAPEVALPDVPKTEEVVKKEKTAEQWREELTNQLTPKMAAEWRLARGQALAADGQPPEVVEAVLNALEKVEVGNRVKNVVDKFLQLKGIK